MTQRACGPFDSFVIVRTARVAEPSRADELLTQTLKTALSLVDVRVLDHMVVAGTDLVSFAERGLL